MFECFMKVPKSKLRNYRSCPTKSKFPGQCVCRGGSATCWGSGQPRPGAGPPPPQPHHGDTRPQPAQQGHTFLAGLSNCCSKLNWIMTSSSGIFFATNVNWKSTGDPFSSPVSVRWRVRIQAGVANLSLTQSWQQTRETNRAFNKNSTNIPQSRGRAGGHHIYIFYFIRISTLRSRGEQFQYFANLFDRLYWGTLCWYRILSREPPHQVIYPGDAIIILKLAITESSATKQPLPSLHRIFWIF